MRRIRLGRERTPLQAAMESDRGRVRPQNQDVCLADAGRGLFAVADGMGGHRGGDVAARIAIDNLPRLLDRARRAAAGVDAALREALTELSALVRDTGAADAHLQGMGTTLVLAVVSGATAHLAHLGDSRAYLLRQGLLERLTEDHSYATELVRGGVLDPVRAGAHPLGHAITRAIGMSGDVQPDVRQVALAQGDRLLLCSDGLTNMLADERIGAILGRGDPGAACRALVAAANDAGGDDNVSVVVVEVTGPLS